MKRSRRWCGDGRWVAMHTMKSTQCVVPIPNAEWRGKAEPAFQNAFPGEELFDVL